MKNYSKFILNLSVLFYEINHKQNFSEAIQIGISRQARQSRELSKFPKKKKKKMGRARKCVILFFKQERWFQLYLLKIFLFLEFALMFCTTFKSFKQNSSWTLNITLFVAFTFLNFWRMESLVKICNKYLTIWKHWFDTHLYNCYG